MPIILVPDDSQIIITEGGEPKLYRPKNGELTVDDSHVASILHAVQGSSLKPESPAKTKPEAPAKE